MPSTSKSVASLLRHWCLPAALLATVCFDAQAALQTTTLQNVTIGASRYDVTFWQAPDGLTFFNQVYGTGSPALTFNTQTDALAAATAIRNAALAIHFDYTAAGSDLNAFVVPFSYTASDFSGYTGWSDSNGFDGIFGPFTFARSDIFGAGFATFALEQAVPETPTVALLGLALAGLGFSQRRRRQHTP